MSKDTSTPAEAAALALKRGDRLDEWLTKHLPQPYRDAYEALQTLEAWRVAVRPPERPNVDPARALSELRQASGRAARVLADLGAG